MLLQINHLKKVFGPSTNQTIALRDVNFSVAKGEYIAIMGESGSGKSTLLNLLATFDRPTDGDIVLNGQDLNTISKNDLAQFRREKLGFVFQNFSTLNTLNNKDNILLPMVLSNHPVSVMEKRLTELTPFLGISDILNKYPYEISGGQRQRVATARALIHQPDILLADEPTGSLDSTTSTQILNLFQSINDNGQTILMVTHSAKAAATANRVLFIKDGIIFHELYRGEQDEYQFQNKITETLAILSKRGDS